jgi:ferredoxin
LWYIIFGILGFVLVVLIIFWLFSERWRLLRPSTRLFMKESGRQNLLNFKSLHGYIYLHWTNHYIHLCVSFFAPLFGKRIVNWLADRYHGKVLTHDLAKRIITLNAEIPLTDLEQIIPYPTARKLVLKGPPDIIVSECPCRSFRDKPCLPTQVCLIIGQPFVNFKLEHSPNTSRLINKEEALKILEEEHKRGHIHSAWFKDVTLDRFLAICNCCKCCCAGVEGMVKYNSRTMASSGYISQINEELCSSCGTCVETCPFHAISIIESKAIIDWVKCLGCGVCATQCPVEAISLIRDEKKGLPMDIRMLSERK